MSALADLQRDFATAMVRGDMAAAEPRLVAGGIPPQRRLQIHAHHYLATLEAALAANFPVVRALLGDGFFGLAARGFAAAEPPREPRLFAYGAGFSSWLAGMPALRALPYVADVARLMRFACPQAH